MSDVNSITSEDNSESEDDAYEDDTNDGQPATKPVAKLRNKSESFVSRNIKLAGDSMAALAITDEEKERLCDLLQVDDNNETGTECQGNSFHSPFVVDSETSVLLKSIDSKLQALRADRCALNETVMKCEHEESGSVYEQRDLKMKHRLHDIERTLKLLKQSASVEIEPVSQEEISKILKKYYESNALSLEVKDIVLDDQQTNSNKDCQNSELLPREALEKVIQDAKDYMPLFQFKY